MRFVCLPAAFSSTSTYCISRSLSLLNTRVLRIPTVFKRSLFGHSSLLKSSARFYSKNSEDYEKLCLELFKGIKDDKGNQPDEKNLQKREEEQQVTSMESRKRKNMDKLELESINISDMMLIPHQVTLEVFSNGTTHMHPSAVLRTPLRCYMFNCPEGSNRFGPLFRIRPNMVHDFFITRANWDNIGGIAGLLLNKSMNEEQSRFHGIKNLKQYLEIQRPLLDTDFGHISFPVEFEERSYEQESFEDAALRVRYIPLIDNTNQTNTSQVQRVDVAYLVELKKTVPNIDPLKLIELKIPKGPHIAELKIGKSITLADGRVIHPEDVVNEKQAVEWPNLLVADIESEAKLDSICNSTQLQEFINNSRTKQLNYIVHFTRQHLLELPAYREWMRTFGAECRHLVLNGSGTPVPMCDGVYSSQLLYRAMFPQAFPQLHPSPEHYEGKIFVQDTDYDESRAQQPRSADLGPVFVGSFFQRFPVRGTLREDPDGLQMDFTPKSLEIDLDIHAELAPKLEEFRKSLDEALTKRQLTKEDPYPRITFLGTASAMAIKYRGVSGHLLELNPKTVLMIDCGEGSFGQMRVLFGPERCAEMLTNLRALFITHSHQDHIYGINSLIQERVRAFKKLGLQYQPLILVSDLVTKRMIDVYSRSFHNIEEHLFYVNPKLYSSKPITNKPGRVDSPPREPEHRRVAEMALHFPRSLYTPAGWDLRSAKAVQVPHTRTACGYVFTCIGANGKNRKIVFSGDTKPSTLLEEQGRNADVLVHEATFEDGLEMDALRKRHSTMRQAFDTSQRMLAKHLILTHFSARYSRVPPLPDYLLEAGNVSVSQDNMVVPFDLLPLFPKLLPVYRVRFREELFNMQVKHMQRQRRNETEEEEQRQRSQQNALNEDRKQVPSTTDAAAGMGTS